ncbi:GNAT family N-acetyltransferase [Streptomyces sp. NPDC052299]|uniref:GNAT family N-acetyltransferase n=1 Tax=Streptomyces sp. NPDC052299 TaxID=3155054 RepID=UPI003438CD2A
MEIVIETIDEIPEQLHTNSWQFNAPALAPSRMAAAAEDPRWLTRWTVARSGDRVLGILNSRSPRGEQFLNSVLDLRDRTDVLGGAVPDDPRRWAFIGSSGELASGALVAASLPSDEAAEVRTALAAAAFARAAEGGTYPAALYVRDGEVASFTAALDGRATVQPVAQAAVLHLNGADLAEHIAALPAKARANCRRDLRRFEELGHTADCVPADEVIAEATPLVCAIKRKYGVVEHPKLCEFRLRQWTRTLGPDSCRAAVVRDADGVLLAASFFALHGPLVESYEIGLVDDLPGREWYYLQTLIHGPVAYALRQGCRSVDLGLDSSAVKKYRGATLGTAWAISAA